MRTPDFSGQSLQAILDWLKHEWARMHPGEITRFDVPDPDGYGGQYSGTQFRSYRQLLDLAEVSGFQFMTPQRVNEDRVRIHFRRVDVSRSWPARGKAHQYNHSSDYPKIVKNEEPWYREGFKQCVREMGIPHESRLLDLGVNRGDEWMVLKDVLDDGLFDSLYLTGIDWDPEAIEIARSRWGNNSRVKLIHHDLKALEALKLPRQQALICLDTLQSSTLNGKELIKYLLKRVLSPEAPILLGFPNCRYLDGEIQYGARMKNFSEPELSLLVKDLFYYRRTLQGQGYRVTLRGKYTVFLCATRP